MTDPTNKQNYIKSLSPEERKRYYKIAMKVAQKKKNMAETHRNQQTIKYTLKGGMKIRRCKWQPATTETHQFQQGWVKAVDDYGVEIQNLLEKANWNPHYQGSN